MANKKKPGGTVPPEPPDARTTETEDTSVVAIASGITWRPADFPGRRLRVGQVYMVLATPSDLGGKRTSSEAHQLKLSWVSHDSRVVEGFLVFGRGEKARITNTKLVRSRCRLGQMVSL